MVVGIPVLFRDFRISQQWPNPTCVPKLSQLEVFFGKQHRAKFEKHEKHGISTVHHDNP